MASEWEIRKKRARYYAVIGAVIGGILGYSAALPSQVALMVFSNVIGWAIFGYIYGIWKKEQ